jgi:hypothetical protein
MEIPDLTRLPADHPPSPYDFPLPLKSGDKWGAGGLPHGSVLVAVGWLGNSVNSSGSVEDDVVDALLEAYVSKAVFSDGTAGWHDCELCPGPEAWYSEGQVGPVIRWRGAQVRLYGHGHHLLKHGSIIYIAPALILHYILDHGYRPPQEFLEATTAGHFLGPDDLTWEAYSPAVRFPAG